LEGKGSEIFEAAIPESFCGIEEIREKLRPRKPLSKVKFNHMTSA
jgi:hypothetical protein